MTRPRPTEAKTRIAVRLMPRARADTIEGWVAGEADAVLRVRVSAPPLQGRANAALVRLLGRALGAPVRDVVIVQGEKSRDKLVEVRGLRAEVVRERLEAAAGA